MELQGKITPTSHYFWDHWTVPHDGRLHRFSLVAPRTLSPDERRLHAEMNHWISENGELWRHRGVAVGRGEPGSFDAQAIWSGCAATVPAESGKRLAVFYTGLAEGDERRQAISVAFLDESGFVKLGRPALEPTEHPDYDLGAGDAIRAWRDPWVFQAGGKWHMVFAAKRRGPAGEVDGAIGHAVASDESLESWELRPPLDLPASYLQMECPAVVEHGGEIYCFVTTRDRVLSPRELAVPGNHGGDALRVYRAPSLDGPWAPAGRPDRSGGDLVLDAAAANIYGVTFSQVPGRGLMAAGYFTRHHHRAYTWTPWMPVRWHWGRPIMAAP